VKQLELFDELPPTKVRVYVQLSKEALVGYGLGAGLRDEALDFFKHYNEVLLDLTVDFKTGEVLKAKVTQ
jgi:hypothetical protein